MDAGEKGFSEGVAEAALREEAESALAAWGIRPGGWRLVGSVPGLHGSILRPVVAVGEERYVVRRQPPDLTVEDARFRHAFMRHLADAGLPVPPLLPRSRGETWAVIGDDVYELQGWREGHPFLSSGPASDARLVAAATTLGRLHQASADFAEPPHVWPEERAAPALAAAYVEMIREAAGAEGHSVAVMHGLTRVADACAARIDPSNAALAVQPGPPELHIHGDYQPHNLAFDSAGVCAIYDFEAARWEARVLEVAYTLLTFTGLRWDGREGLTPPLADDGLDLSRAARFLRAYGAEAPPAEDEAALLSDAVALVFPIVLANGALEDLVFPEDYAGLPAEEDALARLHWADTFWLWLDRYREALAEAWESGAAV
jgi:Ser/Thr protein kinase RdoA (MazF antagonist)